MPQENTLVDKIERTIKSVFPVDKNREGECLDCGECCKLPKECLFLDYDDNGKSSCQIYIVRPLNCRKYPRSEKEHVTQDTCGYHFKQ